MMTLFYYLLILRCCTYTFGLDLSNTYVANLKLVPCNNNNLITISNLKGDFGPKNQLHVSGSLTTSVDLVPPISASVIIQSQFWFGWVTLPCYENKGSCEYEDVCALTELFEKHCPILKKNGLPCGCPVSKGSYTIPSDYSNYMTKNRGFSTAGKYRGKISAKNKLKNVACYTFTFDLKNK